MNQFTVTAPVAGFSGESCGVVFTDGAGTVSDASKEGRAAIEYFRRRGYTLAPVEDEPVPHVPEEDDVFDPAKHDAPEVIAYLDALGTEDSDAIDEFDRVIAAERDGKARKTILQKGADQ